jgi:hypothetical protein
LELKSGTALELLLESALAAAALGLASGSD